MSVTDFLALMAPDFFHAEARVVEVRRRDGRTPSGRRTRGREVVLSNGATMPIRCLTIARQHGYVGDDGRLTTRGQLAACGRKGEY